MWFVYLATGSLILPLVAARMRQRELDRPMRLIAAWYALLLLENAVAVLVREATADGNNLIVAHYALPFEAIVMLFALAEWQVQPLARNTVRLLVPLYLILWVVAMVYVEESSYFTVLSGPTLGFLVLAAALFAFISRTQQSDRSILDTTWGWILPGLAIFFASNVTGTIMLQVFLKRGQQEMMLRVAYLQIGIYLIATLIVSWGFFWPTRPRPFGVSSSPSPSR